MGTGPLRIFTEDTSVSGDDTAKLLMAETMGSITEAGGAEPVTRTRFVKCHKCPTD